MPTPRHLHLSPLPPPPHSHLYSTSTAAATPQHNPEIKPLHRTRRHKHQKTHPHATKQPTPRPNSKTTDLRNNLPARQTLLCHLQQSKKTCTRRLAELITSASSTPPCPPGASRLGPLTREMQVRSKADAAERKWLARHEIITARRRGRQDWQ
jgi:hypothetical protein